MNLHLAKLHNHGFVSAIYGFEVKVFDNISGVEATKFPSQLEVYMCCRPRANLQHTVFSACTHYDIPLLCGYAFSGRVAYAWTAHV